MTDIIRITIKGTSGYGSIDDAYSDRLVIEPDSIRYEYKPIIESEENAIRKWAYKTNSPKFRDLYHAAATAVEEIISSDINMFATDTGSISFTITYEDKRKLVRDFWTTGDVFQECFTIIKEMVPGCECIPAVLFTSDDFEDDLDDEED